MQRRNMAKVFCRGQMDECTAEDFLPISGMVLAPFEHRRFPSLRFAATSFENRWKNDGSPLS